MNFKCDTAVLDCQSIGQIISISNKITDFWQRYFLKNISFKFFFNYIVLFVKKQVISLKSFTKSHGYFMDIAKPCTHLQPSRPWSFQRPLSSLQYPQRYKNQNIALNWSISPNLGQKIQRYPL